MQKTRDFKESNNWLNHNNTNPTSYIFFCFVRVCVFFGWAKLTCSQQTKKSGL